MEIKLVPYKLQKKPANFFVIVLESSNETKSLKNKSKEKNCLYSEFCIFLNFTGCIIRRFNALF